MGVLPEGAVTSTHTFDQQAQDMSGGGGLPRVLVLSSLYPRPGDPMFGVFVHSHMRALEKAGVQVTVVSPVARGVVAAMRKDDGLPQGGSWPAEHAIVDGVEVRYIPFWAVPHALSVGLEIRSLAHSMISAIRRLNPQGRVYDLIHAYWAVPMGAAALEVAAVLQLPVVLSVLGSDIHTYPWRSRRVLERTRQVLARCDRVTAPSARLAEEAQRLAGSAQAREPVVVYNGVDADRFRPTDRRESIRRQLGLPVGGVGFCCVARLVTEKGIWELLRAFREVKSRFPDSWLALVGSGNLLPQLREWIATRGMQTSIVLAGAQDPDKVVDWLNAADVFVLPSHNEGLPNSVLEAMACRLPVVATAVGGIPEAVADGAAGLLVRAGDERALAKALLRVAADRESRESMGERGRATVKDKFTWDSTAEALMGVYDVTLGGPGRSTKDRP